MKTICSVVLVTVLPLSLLAQEPPVKPTALESGEHRAVERLSKQDKEDYLRQRPLGVVRHRFMVSNFSHDESTAELVAVQRSVLAKRNGWRLVLLGAHSLLVFHVSDDGKEQLLVRSQLDDALKKIQAEPPAGGDGKPAPQP